MAERKKTDDAPHSAQAIGTLPLYSLVAVLAAIVGFLSVFVTSRLIGPSLDEHTQLVQIDAASRSSEDQKPSGLEKLVRSDPAKPLPAIRFSDGEGRERTLADWKGKIVLLNLWATWCAPCKVEMPGLDRLQAKLGGPDFAVIPISLDRSGPDKPRQFLEANKLGHLGLYLDNRKSLMQSLNVPGLPLTLIIDREGHEIARLAGTAEWDSPEAEALIQNAIKEKGAR